MSIAIEFKSVTKKYPLYHHITGGFKNLILNLPKAVREMKQSSFVALDNISFIINRGETVAFLGRNGAGKSTTLGLIAGVLKPNLGRVTIMGRVSPLLELGGGFHPDLTGIENIQLNGVLLGLTRKQVAQKIQSIVTFSELGDFIFQPVRTYSSGMLARLGFSVVAHLDPEILLIDEVLAVGDANFRRKCLEKMKEFKNKGVTIILVTHNPADVDLLCDRVIWIENHKVKMDGKRAEILPIYNASTQ
ncbi:ABC transporter ATP-binding protein [Bdellovibrio bacteriovorus]|uniref:ABC transporter ATP-binding protein n=1 Tax=Bdellovibrio bacteriovorus TaxID=959 RepID=UPI0035A6C1EC